ncbi:MAG: hypothetical protein KFF46_03830 [Desulfobacterales bacterium]|nr:hypothetical protein [Desulfobacterales bacterium]
MKDIFKDIITIEGVHGVIVIAGNGQVVTSAFSSGYGDEQSRLGRFDWSSFAGELSEIGEAEFVFDSKRLYVRKARPGYVVVVLDDLAPVSMVRLNCEILLPSLERIKPGRRFGQIFKRRKG